MMATRPLAAILAVEEGRPEAVLRLVSFPFAQATTDIGALLRREAA